MAESLSARSEVAQLRRRCDAYEEAVDRFKRKALALRKQNSDLAQVVKRYIVDCKEADGRKTVLPFKIQRSVGLNVNMSTTTVGVRQGEGAGAWGAGATLKRP